MCFSAWNIPREAADVREDECVLSIPVLTPLPASLPPRADPGARPCAGIYHPAGAPWEGGALELSSPPGWSPGAQLMLMEAFPGGILPIGLGVGSPVMVSREKLLGLIHPA